MRPLSLFHAPLELQRYQPRPFFRVEDLALQNGAKTAESKELESDPEAVGALREKGMRH